MSDGVHRLSATMLALAALVMGACSQTEVSDSRTESVMIAAASDLRFALEEAIPAFKEDPRGAHVEVQTTYGSSGKLFEQIRSGAPFDLFLSADYEYARRLVEEQEPGTKKAVFTYAIGRIAVYIPDRSPIRLSDQGITVLASPDVRRVSIADPTHAPYGKAAMEAMRHYGLLEAVESKLIRGDNAAHAADFVESGGADAGILPVSLLRGARSNRLWTIPADAHSPILQAGVVTAPPERAGAAEEFARFLTSERGRDILSRYGFDLPDRTPASAGASASSVGPASESGYVPARYRLGVDTR